METESACRIVKVGEVGAGTAGVKVDRVVVDVVGGREDRDST